MVGVRDSMEMIDHMEPSFFAEVSRRITVCNYLIIKGRYYYEKAFKEKKYIIHIILAKISDQCELYLLGISFYDVGQLLLNLEVRNEHPKEDI